jgi:putative DNA primase/helicase
MIENLNEEINNSLNEGGKEPSPISSETAVKPPVQHNKMLSELINQITEVDLIAEAKLKQGEKLENKHLLIITVKKILEITRENNWDMCLHHGLIFVFNGEYWQALDREELQWFLGRVAEKLGINEFTSILHSFKKQLFLQFTSQAYFPKLEKRQDIVLINLENGTYEISATGSRLRPFDKNDFLTFQLPFKYDPEAKAETFIKYLDKVLPDKNCQSILAEYLGHLFISVKRLNLEKVLILYGDGANGKSVFYNIVRALLGKEYVSSFSLESLSSEYYRAMLGGKLVNYASEMSLHLNAEIFKKLSSVEPLEARHPYGQPFVMEDYARLIFNTNSLPREVEPTNAFFRRFLIVPFNVTIPESEMDRQLATKIIATELSGIFNWVLDGLNRLLEQNCFTRSELAEQQTIQFREESDNVNMFIDEYNYEKSFDRHISVKYLSDEYAGFCRDCRDKALNHGKFIKGLKALGIAIEKRNTGLVAFVQKKKVEPPVKSTTPRTPLTPPAQPVDFFDIE